MAKSSSKISLCMIVKNEERLLGECLSSVKDFVDEMIVVDTGSEDRTVQIAEGFGAQVHHHPWTGNFSEARNLSLEQARGDWILVLDADERLARRDASKLRDIIRKAKVDGFLMAQRSYLWHALTICSGPNPRDYEEGHEYTHCIEVFVIRFFRNRPGIRYQGRVHELVEPVFLKEKFPFERSKLVIHHFGKVGDPELLDQKRSLYLELGRQKAQEEPTSAPAQYEMGIQLYELQRYEESIPYFEKAHDLDPTYNISLLFIAKCYHLEGHMEKASHYYQRCLKTGTEDPRVSFEFANFNRDQGHLQTARQLFEHLLKRDPNHVLANFNLGGVLVKLNQLDESFAFFKKAATLNPFNEVIFEQLGRLALYGYQMERIAELIEEFLERFPRNTNCPPLLSQIHFRLKRFDRCVHWCHRALELTPANRSQLVLRAHAKFSQSDLDGAERDYQSVLESDPTHLDSLMNLANIAEARGDRQLAESRYAAVLMHYPDQPVAVKKYGLLLARHSPGPEALNLLEKAHQTNPQDTECLLMLGFLYEKQERSGEAIELYRRAEQHNPRLAKLAAEKIRRLEALSGLTVG